MFDRWTSDIAEVKTAASELYSLVSAEVEAGVKAGTININILLVPTGALKWHLCLCHVISFYKVLHLHRAY